MNLSVKEIFYSLQGEGGRQGEASVFIRLTGCNLACTFCDTDFNGGTIMSVDQILSQIRNYPCRWIVWTGGEPMLQLNSEIVSFFNKNGFFQAIESNGHYALPGLLNYTVVSPKGNIDYARTINPKVNEIRLPVRKGECIPELALLPEAEYYFLSPVFTGEMESTRDNINYCVSQIKQDNRWRLSMQMHKFIGIE